MVKDVDMEKEGPNRKNITNLSHILREVVFGVEDGMVSTLGVVTGIAVGSGERYTVLLAGLVVIVVESISMGIGSYISNRSFKEVMEKVLGDEKRELKHFPKEEEKELYLMFLRDGWNKKLASKMVKSASSNKKLLLKEHGYRELGIFPYVKNKPSKNALFMFISYIVGGIFPLVSYFLFPVSVAILVSVMLTLFGLFILGVLTTLFTNIKPIKAGVRLAVMGGFAFLIGLLVGETVSLFK